MRDRISTLLPNRPRLALLSPPADATFFLTDDPAWPSLPFETCAVLGAGETLNWNWRLDWHSYSKSGTVQTATSWWDAQSAVYGCGGVLTVSVASTHGTATCWINLCGTNPSAEAISAYLNSKPNGAGFEKIVQHESQGIHFDEQGYPKKSADNGFGLCQLTNPVPTFEQCWNWQRNLDSGLALFQVKQNEARAYLSQAGRSFTPDQLQYEAVARWNGGKYHVWSSDTKQWVRNPSILCDSRTGNIGWDRTEAANVGKSEAELHKRDASRYRNPPGTSENWGYFGVCYADRLLRAA